MIPDESSGVAIVTCDFVMLNQSSLEFYRNKSIMYMHTDIHALIDIYRLKISIPGGLRPGLDPNPRLLIFWNFLAEIREKMPFFYHTGIFSLVLDADQEIRLFWLRG